MATPDQTRFMRQAIALAQRQVGRTAANPAVGCVIALDGKVVGEAATADGGRPHAEEQALEAAGDKARGAQVFVTLEPCGERTSGGASCALHLLRAGVSEVFIACADASPFASGRGCALLLGGGVAVSRGLLEDEAAVLYAVCRGRPGPARKGGINLGPLRLPRDPE
jgi:diaminohydroxyphosphoribosylaminopyrimidine deaminase/5-amino-6-(5-phosphoribosylamino)uracil reductase